MKMTILSQKSQQVWGGGGGELKHLHMYSLKNMIFYVFFLSQETIRECLALI